VAAKDVKLELDGTEVRITHPDKVFFPERGETKLDLVNYYVTVGEPFMRTIRGRPVLLQRFPEGAAGTSFFQKRIPADAPEWLQTTVVATPNGTTSNALVAADLAHIAWAVNMGCLGFHVWPYHADAPEFSDELRIDLDPSPGVTFDHVREAARETKKLFDELGINAFVKTTGNRGLHIYVRLLPGWDSYDVRAAAVATARELARRRDDLVTDSWWKQDRGTRVFIDFNQNSPHKTVFGAWCARARAGGQVSTPLTWDEVDTLHPDELTIATVPDLVARRGDPWETMNDAPQSLEPLLEMSRRDLANGLQDAPWPPVYPKMANEPSRVWPGRAAKPKEPKAGKARVTRRTS
jgi:DNA ligase D